MTYEYMCKKCDHVWELEQGIKDPKRPKKCPKCNGKDVSRLINSENGFVLNGSCWSKDGYQ
jgi:putative FmdB family regulatory protein